MELHQLKCFYQTARKENMSKAAVDLNISQPALSIAIRKLEDELGVELFVRKGKSIKVSAIGKQILPYIERMLSYGMEITDICRRNAIGYDEIRIRAFDATPIVIEAIAKFQKIYPETGIKLLQNDSAEDIPDIILDATTQKPDEQTADMSYKEEMLIAIPRVISPVVDSPIPFDFIQENELIGMSENYAIRRNEEYYGRLFGLRLKHSIVCDSPSVLRNLITNGTGIAFVPSRTWLFQNNPAITLARLEGLPWYRYITVKATGFRQNRTMVGNYISILSAELDSL